MVKGGIHGVGCASASHGARIMCFEMMKRVKVNGVGGADDLLLERWVKASKTYPPFSGSPDNLETDPHCCPPFV